MRRLGATVIGYGSLMSAHGLARDGDLAILGVRRVQLENARRGFGKASIHADRFAMVVEPIDATRPIRARALAEAELGAAPQAMALELPADALPTIAKREGYSAEAFEALLALAATAGSDVGTYLAALMWECGGHTILYRERLFGRLGYTSPHYIPHPIAVGLKAAVIFLAAGPEGTGSPEVVPVRVSSGVTELLTTAEIWRRKPTPAQLDYIATCLLARAHGLQLTDLETPIPDELETLLQQRLSEPESERRLLERLLRLSRR